MSHRTAPLTPSNQHAACVHTGDRTVVEQADLALQQRVEQRHVGGLGLRATAGHNGPAVSRRRRRAVDGPEEATVVP